MINWQNGKYVKYYLGKKTLRAHLDAVHACNPKADLYTRNIVEGVVESTNCSGIIALISRTEADLNRVQNLQNADAINELRGCVKSILLNTNKFNKGAIMLPHLHLAIHGMKDCGHDIEIGTRNGETCSAQVREWILKEIKDKFENTIIDQFFIGDSSKRHNRQEYGKNFNTFQIEICKTLRMNKRKELIDLFSNVVLEFNSRFCENIA
jgi:N-formylglutamate amidohydrolase